MKGDNDMQDFLLWAVLAHSVVYEAARPLVDDGIDPATIRNDLSPAAPPPQNYAQQTRDTLQAQVDLKPAQYQADATYQPKYAGLSLDNLNTLLNGDGSRPGILQQYQQLQPALQRLQQQGQDSQANADIGRVQSLGSQAVQAYRSANPQQTALLKGLNDQAQQGLDAGGSLTPDEQRQLTEQVRSGQAARGMGTGPADIFAEATTLGNAGFQRKLQRQQFANQVIGTDQTTNVDPFQLILGRSAVAPSAAGGLIGQGQGQQSSVGQSLFNPESSYAGNLYNTNYNAQAASNIAGANLMGGLLGGGLGLAGSTLEAAGNAGGFGKLFGG